MVAEYTTDELAEGSDDEKRLEKAERAAEVKVAKRRKKRGGGVVHRDSTCCGCGCCTNPKTMTSEVTWIETHRFQGRSNYRHQARSSLPSLKRNNGPCPFPRNARYAKRAATGHSADSVRPR